MRSRRKSESSPPEPTQPGRLGGIKPHAHDEDERASREDRDYGSTIFTRPPVPLPRFLTGRKKPKS
jgi:hypothetical protein